MRSKALCAFACVLVLVCLSAAADLPTDPVTKEARQKFVAQFTGLPLRFEANAGQIDSSVKFVARGPGYSVFLLPDEARLLLSRLRIVQDDPDAPPRKVIDATALVRIQLLGARANPPMNALGQLPTKTNYYIGNNPKKWRTGVPTFGKVRMEGVYPGIDLVYYGNQRLLEHDFVVSPGADPAKIRLKFSGAQKISVDDSGELVLQLQTGEVRLHKPAIYQESQGKRDQIEGRYVLLARDEAGFKLGAYDRSRTLVIDPVLVYSTYIGGTSDDYVDGVAVDAQGNIYIAGDTTSSDIPVTPDALDPTCGAGTVSNCGGQADIFAAKFDAQGGAFVSYLGGSYNDAAYNGNVVALDSAGNVSFTGATWSPDFPVVGPATQTTCSSCPLRADAFITSFDINTGVLRYSSFLGGGLDDYAYSLVPGTPGTVWIAGFTNSGDAPVTPGAFTTTGGGGGRVFMAHVDLYQAGSAGLLYLTTIGAGEGVNAGRGAVDGSGNLFLAGNTASPDFPLVGNLNPLPFSPGVFVSNDGAANWGSSSTGVGSFNIKDFATAPGAVFAAGHGVWKSTDGGVTWADSSSGLLPRSILNKIIVDPANPAVLYVATNFHGVYWTQDGGATWTPRNLGIENSSIFTFAFDAVNHVLYAGGLNDGGPNILFKSADSGATWTPITTLPAASSGSLPSRINGLAVVPGTGTTIFYVGVSFADGSQAPYTSRDGGATWQPYFVTADHGTLHLPPAGAGENPVTRAATVFAVHPSNPNIVYVSFPTANYGTYRSLDGGTTFNRLTTSFTNVSLFLAPWDPNTLYMIADTVIKSNDAGVTWAPADLGLPPRTGPTPWPNYMALAPDATVTGRLLFSAGFNQGFLMKLNPAGTSLLYSTFLGGPTVRAVAADPAGSAYVAADVTSAGAPVVGPSSHAYGGGTRDAYIVKLTANGSYRYATYLGGTDFDRPWAIVADAGGYAWVTGTTYSPDFPTTPDAYQSATTGANAFVTKLGPDGFYDYSTVFGGTGGQDLTTLAIDGVGGFVLAGITYDTDLPLAGPSYQRQKANPPGFDADGFVARFATGNDLGIFLQTTNPIANINQPVVLSNFVVVNNFGPLTATGISATITVPAGAIINSITGPAGSTCTPAGATATCTLPDMARNGSVNISLEVTHTVGGSSIYTATITANQPDPITNNNGATTSVYVSRGCTTTPPGYTKHWLQSAVTPDWSNPANWSDGLLPTSSDKIIVCANTSNTPVMSQAASVQEILVEQTARVNTSDFVLTVLGNVIADGTIESAAGSVLMTGATASLQGNVGRLNVAGNVTLSGMSKPDILNITGALTVNGKQLDVAQLTTTGSGVLVMTNPADHVLAAIANFGGGNETGKLTQGSLTIGQEMNVTGLAGSFNASIGHQTAFYGPNTITLNASAPATFGALKTDVTPPNALNISGTVTVLDHLWGAYNPIVAAPGSFLNVQGELATRSSLTADRLRVQGALTVPGVYNVVETTFAGAGQLMPALTYRSVVIDGAATVTGTPGVWIGNTLTVNGNFTLGGVTTVNSDVTVQQSGSLNLNGNALTLAAGSFATSGSGVLLMQSPASTLKVPANISFAGASEAGKLTDGLLLLTGNFSAVGDSFSASGNHTVAFEGPGSSSVVLSASTSAPAFQNLHIVKNGSVLTFTGSAAPVVLGNLDLRGLETVTTTLSGFMVRGDAHSVAGSALIAPDFAVGGQFNMLGTYSVGTTIFVGTNQVIPSSPPPGNVVIASGASVTSPLSWVIQNLTVNGSLILGGYTLTSGPTAISGLLDINGAQLVTTALATTGSGILRMTNPSGSVFAGDVNFGGGTEAGSLTNGVLNISGNLSSAPGVLQAALPHKIVFDGTGLQNITLSMHGLGNVELQNSSGNIQLLSDMGLSGTLISHHGTTLTGFGRRLAVGGVDVLGLVLDRVLLTIEGGALTSFSNVVFQNFAPTDTQLIINNPGTVATAVFSNLQFLTAPSVGGAYIYASDINPTDGRPLTIYLPGSVPADGSAQTFTSGGATVLWGGVASPIPAVSAYSFGSAPDVVGSLLVLTGSNFTPATVVRWNGVNQVTTFVSASELRANIPSDLLMGASVALTAYTPPPGGGISNALTLTILNGYWSIEALLPHTATAGSAATQMSVMGTQLRPGMAVRWNGQARPTTFISSTQLLASLSAADLAAAGTAAVTVYDAATGSESHALTFTIRGAEPPVVRSVSPASVPVAAREVTLTVSGTNFEPASVVRWNGTNLPTTYISSTTLQTTVRATQWSPGTAGITVWNSDGQAASVATLNFAVTDFVPSAQPAAITVRRGQSASVTVNVAPRWGAFGASVSLSCGNLPANVTCAFSPAVVTPGDNGATAVLTVSSAPLSAAKHAPRRYLFALWQCFAVLPVGAVLMGWRRRRGRKLCIALLALGLLLLQVACGGGGGSMGSAPSPQPTPQASAPATADLTINATAGEVVRTTTIVLTVN